ncbi:MAG: hypothetical protein RCG15_02225 [Candidatus Rickettsia vulgarisii]
MIIIYTFLVLLCPYILDKSTSSSSIFTMQVLIALVAPTAVPGVPIFFKHFPVFKRFTFGSLAYAFAKMLMSVISSFSIIYLTDYFGNWGLLLIMLPICFGFYYGIMHFIRLERLKSV